MLLDEMSSVIMIIRWDVGIYTVCRTDDNQCQNREETLFKIIFIFLSMADSAGQLV